MTIEDGFDEIDKLGEGAFGETLLVKDRQNRFGNRIVVVKVPKNDAEDDLRKEATALIQMGAHKNLAKCLGITGFRESLSLVLEFVNGGNLLEKILEWSDAFRSGRTHETLIAEQAIIQILYGIKFIHDKTMYHRDLKPQNILFQNDHNEGILIKIADFGLA